MNENYNKAKRYLYKIDSINYKDILHDAYLNYYRRTGGLNLFERSNSNVIGVVKNQYYERYQKLSYQKDKIRYNYQFVEYEDTPCSITPLDFLIEKETLATLTRRASYFNDAELANRVLEYRLKGYTPTEISEELNITKNKTNWFIKGFKSDRSNNYVKEVEQIKELYNSGKSVKQISIKFKRATATIWNIIKDKTHVCK